MRYVTIDQDYLSQYKADVLLIADEVIKEIKEYGADVDSIVSDSVDASEHTFVEAKARAVTLAYNGIARVADSEGRFPSRDIFEVCASYVMIAHVRRAVKVLQDGERLHYADDADRLVFFRSR